MRRGGPGGEGEEAKQREKLVGAVFKNLQTLGHVWKIKTGKSELPGRLSARHAQTEWHIKGTKERKIINAVIPLLFHWSE